MLFIVPDQRAVRITQGNRVDIAVVFFVVEFVDDVVLRAFAELQNRSLDQLLRVRIMTGKQALPDEFFSTALGIIADGGGIHVNDGVVKAAQHDRCAVLIDHAFEKYRQFHSPSPYYRAATRLRVSAARSHPSPYFIAFTPSQSLSAACSIWLFRLVTNYGST